MAFNDVEMIVLSQLVYYDDKYIKRFLKEPLSKLLSDTEVKNYLQNSLGANYEQAINNLIEKTKGNDFSLVKITNNKDGTGFAAIAIKDPENEVTVAVRGTEGFDLFNEDSRRDVITDIGLGFPHLSEQLQYKDMRKFLEELEENEYSGYYFIGHSLGGNVATYGAFTFKNLNKVKGVITFDSPGFNEYIISKYKENIGLIKDKIINYQNEYDGVSSILRVFGDKKIVKSSVDGYFKHFGFTDHYLSSIKIKGDGIVLKDTQHKNIKAYFLSAYVEALRFFSNITGYTFRKAFFNDLFPEENIAELLDNISNDLFPDENVAELLDNNNYEKNYSYTCIGTTPDTYIEVDTRLLRQYADSLDNTRRKAQDLDAMIAGFYRTVDNLCGTNYSSSFYGYSGDIARCVDYLNYTANEFEMAEREIISAALA